MFLSLFVGCCHHRIGSCLATCGLGKMGYCRRRRSSGYHEPFLQYMLLQDKEDG